MIADIASRRVFASVGGEVRLILGWARRDLRSRYHQSSLRVLWSVIQPLSVIAVYGVIFQRILRVDGGGLPYLSLVVSGLVVWRFVAVALSQSTALVDQGNVMSHVYFRREVVPLSACVAGLVDLSVLVVIMVVLAAVQGIAPPVTLVALPVVLVPVVLYGSAAAVLVSTVGVFVRDITHALPTFQQLLFLATPIMYATSQIPPELQFLSRWNPLAFLVAAVRDVALVGRWPDESLLVVHLVAGGAALVLSIAYLRSIEHRIVDVA